MTKGTTVVNVKVCKDFDVYIGRAMPGFTASIWANPYKVGAGVSREQAIEQFRQKLVASPNLLAKLETLRGRRLGCWCKPLACHGDVLLELLGEQPAEPPAPEQAPLF